VLKEPARSRSGAVEPVGLDTGQPLRLGGVRRNRGGMGEHGELYPVCRRRTDDDGQPALRCGNDRLSDDCGRQLVIDDENGAFWCLSDRSEDGPEVVCPPGVVRFIRKSDALLAVWEDGDHRHRGRASCGARDATDIDARLAQPTERLFAELVVADAPE